MIFWSILVFAVLVYDCTQVHSRNWWKTSFSTIVLLAIIWIGFFRSPGEWFPSITDVNLNDVVKYFVIYCAVGLLWSIIEWRAFVAKQFSRFQNHVKKFCSSRKDPLITVDNIKISPTGDDISEQTLQTLSYARISIGDSYSHKFKPTYVEPFYTYAELLNDCKPTVSDNVQDISGWIAFWPLAIVSNLYLLCDGFFAGLVTMFGSVYGRITDSTFK